MKGHGEKFGRRGEQAIAALLAAPTVAEAARACGIGEATLRRWLRNADFAERYRQARKRLLDAAVSRLHQVAGDAVETLRGIATDSGSPAGSRVAAARSILETALKAGMLKEIEAKLDEVKRVFHDRRYRDGHSQS